MERTGRTPLAARAASPCLRGVECPIPTARPRALRLSFWRRAPAAACRGTNCSKAVAPEGASAATPMWPRGGLPRAERSGRPPAAGGIALDFAPRSAAPRQIAIAGAIFSDQALQQWQGGRRIGAGENPPFGLFGPLNKEMLPLAPGGGRSQRGCGAEGGRLQIPLPAVGQEGHDDLAGEFGPAGQLGRGRQDRACRGGGQNALLLRQMPGGPAVCSGSSAMILSTTSRAKLPGNCSGRASVT